MIIYKKGSVLAATPRTVIAHSCNAQGIWGVGIAKQLATHFSDSLSEYAQYCQRPLGVLGTSIISYEHGYALASLVTSEYYGQGRDSQDKIIRNTKNALDDLIRKLTSTNYVIFNAKEVNSPKINAGLYGVPWEQTEDLIKRAIRNTDITWIVWSL